MLCSYDPQLAFVDNHEIHYGVPIYGLFSLYRILNNSSVFVTTQENPVLHT